MITPIDVMIPLFSQWPSVRFNKCLKLYELAKQATGPIVELGAYTGNGTIALGLGSRDGNKVPVYGVDKWERFTGLYQQQFYPEDYNDFLKNVEAIGLSDIVKPVRGNLESVANSWEYGPINLLVWDVSLVTLYNDFMKWRKLVEPGGLFIAKDTTIQDFGWNDVKQTALRDGWQLEFEDIHSCLYGIRK